MGTVLVVITAFISAVHLIAGQCHDNWTHYHQSCYLYIPDVYTWFDAKVACETVRGKLVEIESAAENNFVANLIAKHSATYAWIGLEDFGLEGEFVWATTQEVPEYTHWQAGEPNNYNNNEDCVMIRDNSQEWIDEHCERDHYPFVCEARMNSEVIG